MLGLLGKLDGAAKAVASAAAAEASGAFGTMELDDETLGHLAEAALGPASEAGGEAGPAERSERVAAATARLRSKRSDLEKRLCKVRKVEKK